MGLDCNVSVQGYRMLMTNGIVAISSGQCGDADAVVANQTWGIQKPNDTRDSGANASYDLGVPRVGLAGSFYRLCWAHDQEDSFLSVLSHSRRRS